MKIDLQLLFLRFPIHTMIYCSNDPACIPSKYISLWSRALMHL